MHDTEETGIVDAETMDALVRRSFGFIDLCGFTSLTDEKGVGEAVAALSTFRAVVRERAGWRGVRVAKWLGDGAMLVSTEPKPLLDAVVRMELALDARGCALPLRAGLAAGRVILFEGDDYIGRSVNLAARLCDEAEPHQLLCTASLFDAAGDGMSGIPLGPRPDAGLHPRRRGGRLRRQPPPPRRHLTAIPADDVRRDGRCRRGWWVRPGRTTSMGR